MTPVYRAYLEPARASNNPLRLALGLGVIMVVYILWMFATGLALGIAPVWADLMAWYHGDTDPAWINRALDSIEGQLNRLAAGGDPWAVIFLLSTFLGAWVGVSLALRLLHKRRARALLGRAPVVLRDFVLGTVLMAVVGGGLALALLPALSGAELAIDPVIWLGFLPLALLAVLIQTGAEELVFRGYIQGQLAARFASPIVWLGVPTVLFGFAHYSPDQMGGNTWIVVTSTALFGLIASDLTARTGSLGLAWGLHFANNVLAILVISVMGGLNGLALFTVPDIAGNDGLLRILLLSDMALLCVVWLACRLWLRRR